jgi:hypothetical protein
MRPVNRDALTLPGVGSIRSKPKANRLQSPVCGFGSGLPGASFVAR